MKVVLRIAGILLAALGLLIVLVAVYSPELAYPGMNLDIGVSILLGGIIVMGLSGVVAAIDDLRTFIAGEDAGLADSGRRLRREPAAAGLASTGAEATLAATVPEGAANRPPVVPPGDRRPPFETGNLEAKRRNLDHDTRSDIDRVVEEVREHASASGDAEVVSEENLYVVEEREIAGKQARVLSDGTVEAETDEGWMRFENPEHLEEYMAAMNVNVGRG